MPVPFKKKKNFLNHLVDRSAYNRNLVHAKDVTERKSTTLKILESISTEVISSTQDRGGWRRPSDLESWIWQGQNRWRHTDITGKCWRGRAWVEDNPYTDFNCWPRQVEADEKQYTDLDFRQRQLGVEKRTFVLTIKIGVNRWVKESTNRHRS